MIERILAAALLATHNLAFVALTAGLFAVYVVARAVPSLRRQQQLLRCAGIAHPLRLLALTGVLGLTGSLLPLAHFWVHGAFKAQSAVSGAGLLLKFAAVTWLFTELVLWLVRLEPRLARELASLSPEAADVAERSVRDASRSAQRGSVAARCLIAVGLVLLATPVVVFFQS
jgi:hypothetical protein